MTAILTAALSLAAKPYSFQLLPLHGVKDGVCTCGKSTCTGTSRGKHPTIEDWTSGGASSDGGVLHRWFADHPERNLGRFVANGGIVIDLDGPEKREWWAEQITAHEPIKTWIVETGREDGGTHIWFRVPHDLVVAARIGPGVEVKGNGGGRLVVVPPSLHYSGKPYTWTVGPADLLSGPADAPEWLLQLVSVRPAAAAAAPGARSNGKYANYRLHYAEGDGRHDHLVHLAGVLNAEGVPQVEAEAAALGLRGERFPDVSDEDVLERVRSIYDAHPDQYGHGPVERDLQESFLANRPRVVDLAETPDWAEIDLASYRDGEPPPGPTILPRVDGVHLFYAGKLHWISGEPEGLKSWLAQIACADAIMAGRHVIYIDFEDGPASVTDRLINLGATWAAVLSFFHYFRPETPMDGTSLGYVLTVAAAHQREIAVLDGVNASMGANDLDPNSSRDFYKWWQKLGAPLRKLTPGAVVCIDHVVKSEENRKQYAAGTGQKLAAVDVHYGIEVADPFGIGLTGRATISLLKDRPGMVQIHAGKRNQGRAPVAKLVMVSDPETREIHFVIEPPDETTAGFRPTHLMEAVSKFVGRGHDGPLYKTTIIEGVHGKNTAVRLATDLLLEEGYLVAVPLGRFTGILESKKYRERDDKAAGSRLTWPLRRVGASQPSQTVPDRPGRLPETDRPTVPPLKGGRSRTVELGIRENEAAVPVLGTLDFEAAS